MLKQYLKTILDIYFRGDAREESYYSTLESLLENYAESIRRKDSFITSLPKKTEGGNPDFRVWDGKSRITGYIEAKSPDTEDLSRIEDTPQLKRYLNTFPNLILTNFMEFRLYKNGALVKKTVITRPVVAKRLKTAPPIENEKEFFELLDMFLSFSMPKTFSAKTLAEELAKRTRFLKDEVTLNEIKKEEAEGKGHLLGFYEAFKKYLMHDISKEEFADLYSQTIAYGLFAARTRAKQGFNRRLAFDLIPATIGILREVFRFISSGDLPKDMEWIVDDLSEVLSNADVNKILHDYFSEGKGKDPIVHFYETFLSIYDPDTRERRGVYYTPEPVVSYIVRSLDIILRESFKKEDGFASDSVTILDPAAGTLTFPAEASRLAVENFTSKYGEGAKDRLIKDHILKNFYAFELMMAPYAIGHIKMGFLLEELGYSLKDTDRFKLYLTNTLEMEEFDEAYLPLMAALSEESRLAGKVKKEQPILVILGNPPYSGHSLNIGDWITKEIKAYYQVDGKPLGEKNPKWLQDDYVKFIRFAQWKIVTAGKGLIGLITNHSWLDNPTFRGMRQSLLKSFDEIYILNLHGNSLKKERCPDKSEDKNVFDIRQGVAISLFVKKGGKEKTGETKVSYADLWGSRDGKYKWLASHDIRNTRWKGLKPSFGSYFLVPRDERLLGRYERFWKVTDVFPVNGMGVTTSRDGFVIDHDKEALKRRIRQFRDKGLPDEIIRKTYGLSGTSKFKLKEARERIIEDVDWERSITQILYRPFDVQWIFYHDALIERTRKNVMRHMMRKNLGLIMPKRVELAGGWQHAFATSHLVEHVAVSLKTGDYLFPLYLYEDYDEGASPSSSHSKGKAQGDYKKGGTAALMSLFEEDAGYAVKRPNISKALLAELEQKYKKAPSPEEIFHYIYAVLYSNTYRAKYAEFLKTDFPRVPFTKDYKLFMKLGGLGKELAELHLMESAALEKPVSRFQGKGDARIKKTTYSEKDKQVHINDSQFFEGIEKEVWEYQAGGYRVMEKWLKDRKGKTLSMEDIRHYCRVATAISATIVIQQAIDKIYPKAEDSL
ncbi:MAG: N-6 DNA methylase [Deltaproteobacteria bacterium]|nr:N-6 DNA methylase [Deltaproteobacteria bacterium]